jgi:hypothetical protein
MKGTESMRNAFWQKCRAYVDGCIGDTDLPEDLKAAAIADMNAALDPVAEVIADRDAKRTAIRESQRLNPEGKADAERKLMAAFAADGATWMPTLLTKSVADAAQKQNLMTAADEDMVYDSSVRGYLRKQRARTTEEIADEREARDKWRTDPETVRRELYRRFVIARDRRARWMERDPVGELVSETDRQWALEWRVQNSEFAPQIALLNARLRAWALIVEAASREFNTSPVSV